MENNMPAKYRVIYDGDSFIDGIDFDDLESAKDTALEILSNWVVETMTEYPDDDYEWDHLIYDMGAWVEKLDEEEYKRGTELDECYYEIWFPSDEECRMIGYVDWEDRDEETKRIMAEIADKKRKEN